MRSLWRTRDGERLELQLKKTRDYYFSVREIRNAGEELLSLSAGSGTGSISSMNPFYRDGCPAGQRNRRMYPALFYGFNPPNTR